MHAFNRSLILLSLISLLILPGALHAQKITISGVVLDAETGESLPGVNVYLAGTSDGAATNETGFYSFRTELDGRFKLVASFLGFKSSNKQVNLGGEKEVNVDFSLEPDLLLMNEVEVTDSRDSEWQKLFSDFNTFFIGTDEYAEQTSILNPEMIDFEPAGQGEYEVTFRQPILVSNDALGYYITLENERIVFNPTKNIGFYLVYPRFQEMESDSRRQRREWEKNRKQSYTGSSRHFFVSLINDRIRTNRFRIVPSRSAIQEVKDVKKIQREFPMDWQRISNEYHVYEIQNVNFGAAHNPELDRNGNIENMDELSSFGLIRGEKYLVLDDYGNVINPRNIVFYGVWSQERYSRELPLNYD